MSKLRLIVEMRQSREHFRQNRGWDKALMSPFAYARALAGVRFDEEQQVPSPPPSLIESSKALFSIPVRSQAELLHLRLITAAA